MAMAAPIVVNEFRPHLPWYSTRPCRLLSRYLIRSLLWSTQNCWNGSLIVRIGVAPNSTYKFCCCFDYLGTLSDLLLPHGVLYCSCHPSSAFQTWLLDSLLYLILNLNRRGSWPFHLVWILNFVVIISLFAPLLLLAPSNTLDLIAKKKPSLTNCHTANWNSDWLSEICLQWEDDLVQQVDDAHQEWAVATCWTWIGWVWQMRQMVTSWLTQKFLGVLNRCGSWPFHTNCPTANWNSDWLSEICPQWEDDLV
jgi:hypothetical protein